MKVSAGQQGRNKLPSPMTAPKPTSFTDCARYVVIACHFDRKPRRDIFVLDLFQQLAWPRSIACRRWIAATTASSPLTTPSNHVHLQGLEAALKVLLFSDMHDT
ncbi:hypothetical protein VOLCADRAFT_100110 [Volvox carteri f. nagariensis]|uniref:Uncharacterized protein n=1 Tax=Volvox carteri f. nagariensis TaxID=3068 RepID=D8UJG1_VOLCA|nr:uncharacterized protein VOLCADRAFT_100110 [Volvox carteri f. nagariensis]EFJ40137.1 hypothetical protein VOLCADRAFT_100110 [Volvox carteri f. nagariensis]|eukprot:XP_002958794.1 hypothetical protein VOLCADRAFT_100110 [Volvox carteri f. nagariensis]